MQKSKIKMQNDSSKFKILNFIPFSGIILIFAFCILN